MEIYKYHKSDEKGEWVIRRHHANGFEGVGVANGFAEAESLCEGMNAAIKLVLWHENGGDDPEGLNEAIGIAKHAVRSLRLPTCHYHRGATMTDSTWECCGVKYTADEICDHCGKRLGDATMIDEESDISSDQIAKVIRGLRQEISDSRGMVDYAVRRLNGIDQRITEAIELIEAFQRSNHDRPAGV